MRFYLQLGFVIYGGIIQQVDGGGAREGLTIFRRAVSEFPAPQNIPVARIYDTILQPSYDLTSHLQRIPTTNTFPCQFP